MKDNLDFQKLKEQARQIQKDCPELFAYLARRDEATAELVREITNSIPNPSDFPQIRIPFVDAVIELAKP